MLQLAEAQIWTYQIKNYYFFTRKEKNDQQRESHSEWREPSKLALGATDLDTQKAEDGVYRRRLFWIDPRP